MALSVLGLDIGGANLKAAHSGGVTRSSPFALWKNPTGLADALAQLLAEMPSPDRLAVTMTGELCDCFATKRQGVLAILNAVEAVAGETPVRVWQTDGRFVDLAAARETPLLAAAANWLALATFAGRFAPSDPALVIDIGSTTTDVIPLLNGKPRPLGYSDRERLRWQELVYTGVRRTPLCALLGGEAAAEVFATTLDVYLVLGDLPEDAGDCSTADDRSATKPAAHARLARMLCSDLESCSENDTCRLARTARDRQMRLVRDAVERVAAFLPSPPHTAILAGSGEFLARDVLDMPPSLPAQRLSLTERLGGELSESACAYAVAVLAAEQFEASESQSASPIVIKVGGSLFDLPDLGTRLRRWLDDLLPQPVLILPGGGPTADVVRDLDQRHALGDLQAHYLALFALSLNARFLANILPGAVVTEDLDVCAALWSVGRIPVLDPYPLMLADEGQLGALPHSWEVTSDSLAARVATVVGARDLILLKSVTLPEPVDWTEAGQRGLVDPYFSRAAAGLSVRALNFRALQP
jgi:probable H4MPT-linked C1 transfer pathway protein